MLTWMSSYISPVLWLVLGIVLAVVEGMSVQLMAIWFALGAAAAAIAAVLGASGMVQFYIFVGVSAVTLIFTRPLVKKKLLTKKESTNADKLIGMVGIVIQPIDNDLAQGRVNVSGLDWAARTQDGEPIEAEQKVKICAIEGVTLIVQPYQK